MQEKIVFGGGCFWCMEAVFQRLKGVEKVTSGYAGGKLELPSYEEVSSGTTGHAEVIEVAFDPAVVTLDDLFAVFFSTHDPTSLDRQGNDVGPQYRSALYYVTPEQKAAAEAFIQHLTEEKTFSKPIVTELRPLGMFYPAEKYHQNYYNNNKDSNPYCTFVIDPKIAKLRQKFSHLLK